MTEKLKHNMMIAEFMGWKFEVHRGYPPENQKHLAAVQVDESAENLRYDSSWDWLMPVVEKISEPEVKGSKITRQCAAVRIDYKNTEILYTDDEIIYHERVQGDTKIESVYKSVVKFINWYNKQYPTRAL